MKFCWIVTQQGAVPIVTINSTALFSGIADLSIPMRVVSTEYIYIYIYIYIRVWSEIYIKVGCFLFHLP